MTNHLKKHGFSFSFPRLFTRAAHDAYDLIHFQSVEAMDDEELPALECPDNWSAEAASTLAEAAFQNVPEGKTIEENTVPSWLWQRTGNENSGQETAAQQIFDRIVGAATYKGWKSDFFADETAARNFFDEARYILMQRFVAFEPRLLATLGLEWAYGVTTKATTLSETDSSIEIGNAVIDAIVSGSRDKAMRTKWQKILNRKTPYNTLYFSDIASDWGSTAAQKSQAIINLMAFRHNDGTVNIVTLRHATRILTLLLDLHGFEGSIGIGFNNLAPLLTALALPYDSDAGRSLAAGISAIITAEAYATSAELAGLRGASESFTSNRDITMRALRNHRRAAYGDRNDYEKISVLPAPLLLKQSPDLGLVAAAQSRWDEALELVRQHGLRHTQVTTLGASPSLTLFMENATQGLQPLAKLTVTRSVENEIFREDIHPSLVEALSRLGYDNTAGKAIIAFINGKHSLDKAPHINHASLRAKGFDKAALERIEDYLPSVNDIHLAFTPWILGEEFCRKTLKIAVVKLKNARFDLLKHLGFSAEHITAANAYCYGHGSAVGAPELKANHRNIFARESEVTPEARIKMAAAVQSFMSGNVGLQLPLPADLPTEKTEKLFLSIWRQGIKTAVIHYVAEKSAAAPQEKRMRKIKSAAFLHTNSPALPKRHIRARAENKLVGLSRTRSSSSTGKRT